MPGRLLPASAILNSSLFPDTRPRDEILGERLAGRVLDSFHSPGPREFVVRGGFFNFFETRHDVEVYERVAERLSARGLGIEVHRYEDRKLPVDFGVDKAVLYDRIHITSIGGAAVVGTTRFEDLPGHVSRIYPPEADTEASGAVVPSEVPPVNPASS